MTILVPVIIIVVITIITLIIIIIVVVVVVIIIAISIAFPWIIYVFEESFWGFDMCDYMIYDPISTFTLWFRFFRKRLQISSIYAQSI